MKRNGTIDLMKFILAAVILLFHGSKNLTDETLFDETAVAVEFFFLVSGWLMASRIARVRAQEPGNVSVGEETVSFLGGKIRRLLPDYHIAWLIAFAATEVAEKAGVYAVLKDGLKGLPEFLFLTASGLFGRRVNHAVWYVSAMLIAMAVLYPVARRFGETFNRLIAPLIAVFIYGFLNNTADGTIAGPATWVVFTTKGLLRGFAAISLGCTAFSLSGLLSGSGWKERPGVRRLATAAEWVLYGAFLGYLWEGHDRSVDYVFILLLFAAVSLSFSGLTLSDRLLDNRAVYWLGEFSYDLFLCHGFWSHVLEESLGDQSFGVTMAVYVALSVGTALFVRCLSRWIRRRAEGRKNAEA